MTEAQIDNFTGKRVLVQGLGRFGGGLGVTRWLVAQGAIVTVTDTEPAERLRASVEQLAGLPVQLKLGGHDLADFTHTDVLVSNPAVNKATSEHVQAALGAGVVVTSEMNLFLERCPALTIGITGSVGKSTTTMMTYLAVQAAVAGQADPPRVFLGGNIGKSLLLDLPTIRPQDIVVLELSSFMLEETPAVRGGWSPNIAVVTNLFPNHLDRHTTLAAYAAAKQNILRYQRPEDLAILNADHELVARWASLARGRVVKFSTRGPQARQVKLLVPGAHNQSNAQAALAVVEHLPQAKDRAAAAAALDEFRGLPHRLELVHVTPRAGGGEIRFYNDSKATSPDASITALQAFPPATAVFIVGGYDKHIDLTAFEKLLAQRAGGIVAIGQTGQAILNEYRRQGGSAVRGRYAGTLAAALPLAVAWCRETPGLTAIVLSPASASWDQFANYEQRGEEFATLAQGITNA